MTTNAKPNEREHDCYYMAEADKLWTQLEELEQELATPIAFLIDPEPRRVKLWSEIAELRQRMTRLLTIGLEEDAGRRWTGNAQTLWDHLTNTKNTIRVWAKHEESLTRRIADIARLLLAEHENFMTRLMALGLKHETECKSQGEAQE